MKTCPTCGAHAFDDAEVCFGCLYRYGQEPPAKVVLPAPTGAPCPAKRPEVAPLVSPSAQPVEALSDDTGWVVRFELPGYAPTLEANGQEHGFVVRFQPEAVREPAERRRERIPRGTHVRDAPEKSRALSAATGCS